MRARFRGCGDGLRVKRHEPAQIHDADFDFVNVLQNFRRLPREVIPVAVSENTQILALAVDMRLAERNRLGLRGRSVMRGPKPILLRMQVARHVKRDRFKVNHDPLFPLYERLGFRNAGLYRKARFVRGEFCDEAEFEFICDTPYPVTAMSISELSGAGGKPPDWKEMGGH